MARAHDALQHVFEWVGNVSFEVMHASVDRDHLAGDLHFVLGALVQLKSRRRGAVEVLVKDALVIFECADDDRAAQRGKK